jgi:hypothetical protein
MKRQPSMWEEVDTHDLPGSDFMLPGGKKLTMTMKIKTKKLSKRLPTRMTSCILNQVRRMRRRMMEMTTRLNGSCVYHVRYEKKRSNS